jgi:hypothetical protein
VSQHQEEKSKNGFTLGVSVFAGVMGRMHLWFVSEDIPT